jgi:hypothetical protein
VRSQGGTIPQRLPWLGLSVGVIGRRVVIVDVHVSILWRARARLLFIGLVPVTGNSSDMAHALRFYFRGPGDLPPSLMTLPS